MRGIIAEGSEVDLAVFFNGFPDQIKGLFEDNGLPFVLRQKGIRGKHVAEVIGKSGSAQKAGLDVVDVVSRFSGRLHGDRRIVLLSVQLIGLDIDVLQDIGGDVGDVLVFQRGTLADSLLDVIKDSTVAFLILFVIIDDQCIVKLVSVKGTVFFEELKAFHIL